MRHTLLAASTVLGAALLLARGYAQSPKPQPDVLVLADDERLSGRFVRSNGGSLTFKSDMLGELTIDWSKVKELHAGGRYVVVSKGERFGPRVDLSRVPTGKIDVADKSIKVTPAAGVAPAAIPVADAAHVIEQAEFEQKVLHEPRVFEAWNGAVTAGASIVEATQQSRTFTGAISLVRAVPSESWLTSRNRTSINFSASDGFQLQPGTPKIKTAILHGDIERDEYFPASRVYGFGQAAYDHNFSQGLDLGQQYGGGIGWTVVKNAANTLDLKGGVSYLKQQFQSSSQDKSLAASTFSEGYTHKFRRGIVLLQQLSATPTWNDTKSWLAAAGAGLTVPVYKRLNFSVNLQDNYLHNPSPGFKRNSFQAATGLTYTLR